MCCFEQILEQRLTKQQLYGLLPPISETIEVRRAKLEGLCWRSKFERIRVVPLKTPTHWHSSVGRPAKTFSYGHLHENTAVLADEQRYSFMDSYMKTQQCCLCSKDSLLWTPTNRRFSVGWKTRTYINFVLTPEAIKRTYQERWTLDNDG